MFGPEHTQKQTKNSTWQEGFLAMLPVIQKQAQIAFRTWSAEAQEEAVADVVANAMCAYRRLFERGELQRAFASALARYAVAQYRVGRRVGCSCNVGDVMSPRCQQHKCVKVQRLEEYDDWQELLIEDRRSTPAEIAAIRIDFQNWLKSLTKRERRIVETLASGEPTCSVGKLFRISGSRVSQLRREFYHKWQRFIGELESPLVAAA